MTQYENATVNANDGINYAPYPEGYKPKEVEIYYGDAPSDSTYHYRNGKWFDINLENMEDESVVQILIDAQWAYIQTGDKVLLDRIGGCELPEIPSKDEMVTHITRTLQS